MTGGGDLERHRLAVLEMLEEAFRDPEKRSVLRTRGVSMRPFLREHDEVVIAAAAEGRIRVGELIVYRRGTLLVVHRVAAIVEGAPGRLLYDKGDNNLYLTPVIPTQVLGVVTEVVAGGRRLDLTRPSLRRLGVALARYGLRAVKAYDLARSLGRHLVRPGSGPSRLLRRGIHVALQAPIYLTASVARRWG